MKIELNKLTAYEQSFVKAAVAEWNDLMFGDDIGHGIPKDALGGVMSSLVKKNIIAMDGYHRKDAQGFQFIGDDGWTDYDNPPELV